MAEITPSGITTKTLAEYLTEIRDKYRDINSAWNLEPESPDGLATAIWAELFALMDEELANAYLAADPNSAQGQQLDRIMAFAGLTRNPATPSTVQNVEISGVDGTIVPDNFTIRHAEDGTEWQIDSTATISGGTATASFTCTTTGPNPASVGTLTEIVTPVSGVNSVTNNSAATLGKPEESDQEARVRRNRAVARPGSNQIDNIFAEISEVDGFNQAIIYENATSSTDSNGLEPHSIAVFVDGGTNQDVVDAIKAKKNPGCAMNDGQGIPNEVSIDTNTELGNPIRITFFRPDAIDVYVEVNVKTSTLSTEDKDIIKQEIVNYANSGFSGTSGFDKSGFSIGERIPAGKLYTPTNFIVNGNGYVESIFVGTSPSPSGNFVDFAFNELGVITESNITVNYV